MGIERNIRRYYIKMWEVALENSSKSNQSKYTAGSRVWCMRGRKETKTTKVNITKFTK